MKQAIVKLEEQSWEALSSERSEALKFYADLLTDDSVMVFPGGMVIIGKEEILKSIGAQPWKTFKLEGEKVLSFSDEVATIVYKVTAQRAESDPYIALISSTYVRRDESWKLILHQQTPV